MRLAWILHSAVIALLEVLQLVPARYHGSPIDAVQPQPAPDLGRGDELSVVSVAGPEPAAITMSAPGIQPGTGELVITGHEPTVLARAVEAFNSQHQASSNS
jgi:hypothetical protein